MFILQKMANYAWPIEFKLPTDGGKYAKHSFEAVFKVLSQSKLTELLNAKDSDDKAFCREVVVGWKGMKDESGQDLAFSATALDELLEVPTLATAIATAYLESIAGAKAKN